jgi:hypothetical protein
LVAPSQIEFKEIIINLRSFEGNNQSVVRVTQSKESTEMEFENNRAHLPFGGMHLAGEMHEIFHSSTAVRRRFQSELFEMREQLTKKVPAVWLPVSRRLPIADEEEAERRRLHRRPLESVDECLAELLEGLQRYRVSLDSHLSELRKDFQVHALETILYDKQHDKVPDFRSFRPPSENEKEQLLQAFTDVGFTDHRIKKRIDEHFSAAEQAVEKLQKEKTITDITNLFIIPLINQSHPDDGSLCTRT